jgi:hypothetical protein
MPGMQNDPSVTAEALSLRSDLTFGDGFRFGCGFMAAVIVFWIVLSILVGVLAGLAFLIAPGLSRLIIP